jgi:hypothetical protein
VSSDDLGACDWLGKCKDGNDERKKRGSFHKNGKRVFADEDLNTLITCLNSSSAPNQSNLLFLSKRSQVTHQQSNFPCLSGPRTFIVSVYSGVAR